MQKHREMLIVLNMLNLSRDFARQGSAAFQAFLGGQNETLIYFLKLFGHGWDISQQHPGTSRTKSLASQASRDIPNF